MRLQDRDKGVQLLDSEQLEYAFHLHGIDRDVVARRFYTELWAIIQAAEKIRDPTELGQSENNLRYLCRTYFSTMRRWQQEEEEKHEHLPCCGSSLDNAREASAMLGSFEKQFFRYILCYLELNRALIQVRVKVSHFAQGINIDTTDVMDINHGTGAVLNRLHTERIAVMEKRLRFERARVLLHDFDPLMESLGDDLPKYLGHNEGDHQLTLFKGAVRKREFARARDIANHWDRPDIATAALRVIDMAQKNQDELTAQDGLMLHTGELSLIFAFLKGDEALINQSLDKFNVPYMVFQYKNLIHLGYLLGRIGSIEALIIQHAKLLSLSARPHDDPAYAQVQEQAVLVPARALLQQRFRTLGPLFNDMETTIAVLEKLFAQTREYTSHTPLQ